MLRTPCLQPHVVKLLLDKVRRVVLSFWSLRNGEDALWPVVTRAVSCRVVSCRVVSCRVVSCRVVSCRVVSYRVVSCRVVSCRVVSCSCRSTTRLTLPRRVEAPMRMLLAARCPTCCCDSCGGSTSSSTALRSCASCWTVSRCVRRGSRAPSWRCCQRSSTTACTRWVCVYGGCV
jgi:hypothetical protein